MSEINFTIRMHRDSTWTPDDQNHTRPRWKIQIADRESGMQLAELRLTDEQWAAMHTGTGGEGVAAIPSVDIFRRIGKTSWNVSILMNYEWNTNDPDYESRYGHGHRNDQGLLKCVQRLDLVKRVGGETVSTTRHNNGLSVTVRGYADLPEDAVEAAAWAGQKLAEIAAEQNWKDACRPHINPTAASLERDRDTGWRSGL